MKILKSTIIAVVVFALLKALEWVLDGNSPDTITFHRQFIFCLQLMVLLWLVVIIPLQLLNKGNSWMAKFLPVILALLVIGGDMLFYYLLQRPEKIPDTAVKAFSDHYTNFERNIVQYEPCTVYDSNYFYQLMPGLRFSFGNIEYQNQYNINSESLRDNESDLFGPAIVCAGDSYTLGWGVQENETFASLLASQTGKVVLNAGNSSFGTVRELKKLSDLDTSVMEYLVIQYCRNDVDENYSYVQNGHSLVISPEKEYLDALSRYKWTREYFPGKYAVSISYDYTRSALSKMFRGERRPRYLAADPVAGAKYFLDVFNGMKLDTTFKIIVTDLNGPRDMNGEFLRAVDSMVQLPVYVKYKDALVTLDLSKVLTADDYYILDTHLKPAGHVKVAEAIASQINKMEQAKSNPGMN